MEKLLKASGQTMPAVKRVLEVNLEHPLMSKIKALFESNRDNPALADYCEMLYDLAVIAEGGKLENPSKFSRIVGEAMANAAMQ
jgi:molecular chaperone HtpG